jgi:SAM-dependent methyltransferase
VDPAYVTRHIEEDRKHWWFQGRLAVLRACLQELTLPCPARILDLGCGTGNVLAGLRDLGETIGMEMNESLRAVAQAAGLDVRQGALPDDDVVAPGWADVALLLDVIEHVDDDGPALKAAHRALHPGGWVVVTVPAFPWLWSAHDVVLGHRRRYTAPQLRGAAERAGFRVIHLSYFNTILFPVVLLARIAKRLGGGGGDGHDLRRPPSPINRLLTVTFALERFVVPRRRLPFGSSLVLIARR